MRNNNQVKIGILGFGNMGQAIFRILKKKDAVNNHAFTKNTLNKNARKKTSFHIHSLGVKKVPGAFCVNSTVELFNQVDLVFLCVKPQDFYAMEPIEFKNDNLIVISIMAGVPVSNIKKIIKSDKIVRTMPNLNLMIGEGVIGWWAKKNKFNKKQLALIENLFNSFGQSFYLKNERMLDAITAVSGSGPAYVFLFFDALVEAAQKLGFNKNEAREIVTQTISGSLSYLSLEKNTPPAELIERIKSKKGTTEAALKAINRNNEFYKKWRQAVDKAYKRAQELSDLK